jgi:hypothetical protein
MEEKIIISTRFNFSFGTSEDLHLAADVLFNFNKRNMISKSKGRMINLE